MKIIGISSGCMYKKICPGSKEIVDVIRNIGACAIEVSCIQVDELDNLKIKKEDLKDFSYISFHAPSAGFIYRNNEETIELLRKIEKVYKEISFSVAVFHPDIIEDWSVFKNFQFPMAIENMDNRKKFGLDVEQLENIFRDNNQFKFVLDVNHCYTLDQSLKNCKEMIIAFRDRIVEVHISGYKDYHYPLYLTWQNVIINSVRELKTPFIIESVCNTIEILKAEYKYIDKNIRI